MKLEQFLRGLGDWVAITLMVMFFAGMWAAGASAEANMKTHSTPSGARHTANCNPEVGYVARHEGDPCWLIQSPSSGYNHPIMAIWAVDYREGR